jgi:hypothetical protein
LGSGGVGTCVAVALLLTASDAGAQLTEAPRLLAVYDTILDARFDRVDAALKQACPPAPDEACRALSAVSVYWQILLEPESRTRDERFKEVAAAALAASEAWSKRVPRRAEAWFYLAGSYAPRVQYRILRGDRLAAARDGRRILDALERTLRLDPSLDDAYFGIGLYHYYADVAPAAVKMLRFLMLLPGGDRARGLREMLQARERGALLQGEADFQLHAIYLWYEHQPSEAIQILRKLDAQHPFNPLFLQRIAEAQERQLHDRAASAITWRALLDRARAGTVQNARGTEQRASRALATIERSFF